MRVESAGDSALEALRAEVKKLSLRAVKAKMDMHDLAEDLPVNWELIPEVARRALEIYDELQRKRQQLMVGEQGSGGGR